MVRRRYHYNRIGLVLAVYLLIGIVVAVDRGYITASLLKGLLSAVLAVLLWFLVLLGVNLRVG